MVRVHLWTAALNASEFLYSHVDIICGSLPLYPSVVGDPVQLPGLAVVIRKGLLKMTRVPIRASDNKLNQYHSVISTIHTKEFAASILEFAKDRWGHRAGGAV